MLHKALLPAIHSVLESIRHRQPVSKVVATILQTACSLARASHGSFVLVDHDARKVRIDQVFGADWTPETQGCQLAFGEGLTGRVAMTGEPLLCRDTTVDPYYYPLFDYVRSELVVPVVVHEKVWGMINIDGPTPHAFDETTLQLLTVFAELTAFAITLRLEIDEQDKLFSKLLESEKLASLGEALAGIAHEINNPLTAILGYANLLQNELFVPSQRDAAEVIASEAQRAGSLINGVLEFSRRDTGEHHVVDATSIIQHAVRLQKLQLRARHITLNVRPGSMPLPVSVCPAQITQVLLNLITNSIQAFPVERKDATITIACEREGNSARLTVSDNGPGIPHDVQKKIFDPFFTTKSPGEGTGLGLAIAHSIVEAHRGWIRLAHSSPDGTTFAINLPLADGTSESTGTPLSHGRQSGAPIGGRILLVDDEPNIIGPLSGYLSSQRVEVRHARSGNAALECLQTESFDAVVTDIRMQGMDGLQLYDHARRLHSAYEKRFVFMSGYMLRDHVKSFFDATGVPCLQKPFSFGELHSVLTPLLGHERSSSTVAPAPSRQM